MARRQRLNVKLRIQIEPLAKLPLSVVGETQLEAAVLRLAGRSAGTWRKFRRIHPQPGTGQAGGDFIRASAADDFDHGND